MNHCLTTRVFAALWSVVTVATAASAAEFITLPGPWLPYHLSRDGSSIVGALFDPNGPSPIMRWTRGGLEELTSLPVQPDDRRYVPHAISADASVMAGTLAIGTITWRPYVWNAGQTTFLDKTFYDFHFVGSTADGTSMFGYGYQGPGTPLLAYRWTQAKGLEQLNITLDEPNGSDQGKVSADGSVLAGAVVSKVGNTFKYKPFRWTEQTGTVPLFSNEDQIKYGNMPISGISADGRVIIGRSDAGPIRWTAETGPRLIPLLPGFDSPTALGGISADGSVIVGTALYGPNGARDAFIWDTIHGTRNLRQVLIEDHGLDSLRDWESIFAERFSDDGRVIVGQVSRPDPTNPRTGRKFEYFMAVLDVPEPSTFVLATALGLPLAVWQVFRSVATLARRHERLRN
jgi:uncharacterized membrane protein